jgi:methyltransferase (TIGR00027 family)
LVEDHDPELVESMKKGQASITAQRVAAQRLTFDREPTPYGNAAADELLAGDVAAGMTIRESRMGRYLAARTSFFDRVVVRALDGGVRQVVIAGAGYDGRALRYAKPGVHWFEVDHPDTQHDKRERLERLGIDTENITFVPVDFTTGAVASAIAATSHDSSAPSLILCEGVAVYLDLSVFEALLRGLRAIAAPRSRFAMTVSLSTDDPGLARRREVFQNAVASIGEPARTVLTVDDISALLDETGWAPTDAIGQERARRAGFLIAEPV